MNYAMILQFHFGTEVTQVNDSDFEVDGVGTYQVQDKKEDWFDDLTDFYDEDSGKYFVKQ